MEFKALNRALLYNKAIRVHNKKNSLKITALQIDVLYSAICLQSGNKAVTISNINLFMLKQSIQHHYESIRLTVNYFLSVSILIPSLTKDHCFTVSSYGVSVLNSFELCLRRVRHDR